MTPTPKPRRWYRDRDFPEIKAHVTGEPSEILAVVPDAGELQKLLQEHNAAVELLYEAWEEIDRTIRGEDTALSRAVKLRLGYQDLLENSQVLEQFRANLQKEQEKNENLSHNCLNYQQKAEELEKDNQSLLELLGEAQNKLEERK